MTRISARLIGTLQELGSPSDRGCCFSVTSVGRCTATTAPAWQSRLTPCQGRMDRPCPRNPPAFRRTIQKVNTNSTMLTIRGSVRPTKPPRKINSAYPSTSPVPHRIQLLEPTQLSRARAKTSGGRKERTWLSRTRSWKQKAIRPSQKYVDEGG